MTAHRVAVVDYGGSNIRSVVSALERVVASPSTYRSPVVPDESASASPSAPAIEAFNNTTIAVVDSADGLKEADHIVLPGQGSFRQCIEGLRAIPTLYDTLTSRVRGEKIPMLGICVGLQILTDSGYEDGHSTGLGWVEGVSLPFGLVAGDNPVPHTGWNNLTVHHHHGAVPTSFHSVGGYYYFNHGHIVHVADTTVVWGSTSYATAFASFCGRENVIGVQFHPEKSGHAGLHFLHQFLQWDGRP